MKTKLIVSYAVALSVGVGVCGSDKPNDLQQESNSTGLILNEWYENGMLWQEVKSPESQRAPMRRRIAIADELWAKSKDGITTLHQVATAGTNLLTEFDTNLDKQIDRIWLDLADGRRIEIVDKDNDGEFEKVGIMKK